MLQVLLVSVRSLMLLTFIDVEGCGKENFQAIKLVQLTQLSYLQVWLCIIPNSK